MSTLRKCASVLVLVASLLGSWASQSLAETLALAPETPTYAYNALEVGGLDPHGTFSNLQVSDLPGNADLTVTSNSNYGMASYVFDLAPGATSLSVHTHEFMYADAPLWSDANITATYKVDGGNSQTLFQLMGWDYGNPSNFDTTNAVSFTPINAHRTVELDFSVKSYYRWTEQLFRVESGSSSPGFSVTASFAPVPEPASIVLLVSALLGLVCYSRRRHR